MKHKIKINSKRGILTEKCPVCEGKWKQWSLSEGKHDEIHFCVYCDNGKVTFTDYIKMKQLNLPKKYIRNKRNYTWDRTNNKLIKTIFGDY